ncbi:hypothetical protein EDEG_00533 [Edhazardia aedis USNM 41457]|uniref:Integrator complex subunit 1 R4 domain-containing protein n=1 Tax=Edhazardia aedis (strain USNM 41457) TaxID=1003232 RepID=J9DF77_EDHAE|nr:hypothetical protein EDEG_00533 [Edhazardia aedis USNM 41457]|eukprot:EJW01260.1 hypothetical protein EDEG_00533 [Edhazardia aedis USNM 41457]
MKAEESLEAINGLSFAEALPVLYQIQTKSESLTKEIIKYVKKGVYKMKELKCNQILGLETQNNGLLSSKDDLGKQEISIDFADEFLIKDWTFKIIFLALERLKRKENYKHDCFDILKIFVDNFNTHKDHDEISEENSLSEEKFASKKCEKNVGNNLINYNEMNNYIISLLNVDGLQDVVLELIEFLNIDIIYQIIDDIPSLPNYLKNCNNIFLKYCTVVDIKLFFKLIESESYILRNTFLEVLLKYILWKEFEVKTINIEPTDVLIKDHYCGDKIDKNIKTNVNSDNITLEREASFVDHEWINIFVERLNDVNFYVRIKAIHNLGILVSKNLLNIKLIEAFKKVSERILDTTINVRKRAINFFGAYLMEKQNIDEELVDCFADSCEKCLLLIRSGIKSEIVEIVHFIKLAFFYGNSPDFRDIRNCAKIIMCKNNSETNNADDNITENLKFITNKNNENCDNANMEKNIATNNQNFVDKHSNENDQKQSCSKNTLFFQDNIYADGSNENFVFDSNKNIFPKDKIKGLKRSANKFKPYFEEVFSFKSKAVLEAVKDVINRTDPVNFFYSFESLGFKTILHNIRFRRNWINQLNKDFFNKKFKAAFVLSNVEMDFNPEYVFFISKILFNSRDEIELFENVKVYKDVLSIVLKSNMKCIACDNKKNKQHNELLENFINEKHNKHEKNDKENNIEEDDNNNDNEKENLEKNIHKDTCNFCFRKEKAISAITKNVAKFNFIDFEILENTLQILMKENNFEQRIKKMLNILISKKDIIKAVYLTGFLSLKIRNYFDLLERKLKKKGVELGLDDYQKDKSSVSQHYENNDKQICDITAPKKSEILTDQSNKLKSLGKNNPENIENDSFMFKKHRLAIRDRRMNLKRLSLQNSLKTCNQNENETNNILYNDSVFYNATIVDLSAFDQTIKECTFIESLKKEENISDYIFFLKEKELFYNKDSVFYEIKSIIIQLIGHSNEEIRNIAYISIFRMMQCSSELFQDHKNLIIKALTDNSKKIRNTALFALADFIKLYSAWVDTLTIYLFKNLFSSKAIKTNAISLIYNLVKNNHLKLKNYGVYCSLAFIDDDLKAIMKRLCRDISENDVANIFYDTFVFFIRQSNINNLFDSNYQNLKDSTNKGEQVDMKDELNVQNKYLDNSIKTNLQAFVSHLFEEIKNDNYENFLEFLKACLIYLEKDKLKSQLFEKCKSFYRSTKLKDNHDLYEKLSKMLIKEKLVAIKK